MPRTPNYVGSVHQRKEGRWRGNLQVNGQRVSVSRASRREVERKTGPACPGDGPAGDGCRTARRCGILCAPGSGIRSAGFGREQSCGATSSPCSGALNSALDRSHLPATAQLVRTVLLRPSSPTTGSKTANL